MRIEKTEKGLSLIYEEKKCSSCDGKGTIHPIIPCPLYNKPMRGKPCPHCGSTTKTGHGYLREENSEQCSVCLGKGLVMEDKYCFLPKGWIDNFDIAVKRQSAEFFQLHPAFFLGLFCFYSVSDYGKAWKGTDEEVIAAIRKETGMTQAHKLFSEKEQMVKSICVILAPNGYIVCPCFE